MLTYETEENWKRGIEKNSYEACILKISHLRDKLASFLFNIRKEQSITTFTLDMYCFRDLCSHKSQTTSKVEQEANG